MMWIIPHPTPLVLPLRYSHDIAENVQNIDIQRINYEHLTDTIATMLVYLWIMNIDVWYLSLDIKPASSMIHPLELPHSNVILNKIPKADTSLPLLIPPWSNPRISRCTQESCENPQYPRRFLPLLKSVNASLSRIYAGGCKHKNCSHRSACVKSSCIVCCEASRGMGECTKYWPSIWHYQ